MPYRAVPDDRPVCIAHRHVQIEMWLIDSVVASWGGPSVTSEACSVALLASLPLMALGDGLESVFGSTLLILGFAACVLGILGLVLSGNEHKRLFRQAVRRGLPRSRLNVARWSIEEDAIEGWRETTLAWLLWWRYWDGHPMSPEDHLQLAALLRRGAQRPRPLQIRLLGTQLEYLKQMPG